MHLAIGASETQSIRTRQQLESGQLSGLLISK